MMRLWRGGAELRDSKECQTSRQESEETFLPREQQGLRSELPAEAASQRGEHPRARIMPQGWPDVLSRLLGYQ